MRYIFVINGRQDKAFILGEVEKKLAELGMSQCDTYVTTGVGDGTRYVRIWCDLHREETACFVACGSSGTVNEVASGIVGFEHKCMAIWHFAGSCDFIKALPGRDFSSLEEILAGEHKHIDIIRVGDSYALNMVCVGFSAIAAAEGSRLIEEGKSNPYVRGVFLSILNARINRLKVIADGKPLNRHTMLTGDIANGIYSGGQYKVAPQAKIDDGLMEVLVIRPMLLISFIIMNKYYEKGEHLTRKFCLRRLKRVQAKHVELVSPDLITLSLDGEIVASSSFSIDILPGAIDMILPRQKTTGESGEETASQCTQ